MKIAENTPYRLVVVENPWFAVTMLVGVTVAVAGMLQFRWEDLHWTDRIYLIFFLIFFLAALRYFVMFVRIELDRATGRVNIVRKGLMRRIGATRPLAQLKHARADRRSERLNVRRAVLEFDEKVVDQLDAAELRQREKLLRWGIGQTPPNETLVTYYYSGVSDVIATVDAVNDWLEADDRAGRACRDPLQGSILSPAGKNENSEPG